LLSLSWGEAIGSDAGTSSAVVRRV
jgi:hypothetical protein